MLILDARQAYIKGLILHLAHEETEQNEIALMLERSLFLTDLRFHDVRHEATSRLAEAFPLHELTRVTGNQDTRMLMRY